MTTEECYKKIGGNYAETYGRFGDDALIRRFALKFISDKSFQSLEENMPKTTQKQDFRRRILSRAFARISDLTLCFHCHQKSLRFSGQEKPMEAKSFSQKSKSNIKSR